MSDEEKYPAPALARGIRILQALNAADGPMTLEQLAQAVGYPKASLLRLLETLSMLNLVQRDSVGKSYSALAGVTFKDHRNFVRGVVRSEMEKLTSATGITTEWYEPGDGFMRLVDLIDPPNAVVRISARVGFRRPLDDELEAVTRIALAFPDPNEAQASLWQYVEDGEKAKLSLKECRRQIIEARSSCITMDPHWNSNGIRRYAVAVMNGENLVGILALAETFTPGADKCIDANLEQLKMSASAVEKELG